ncbi:MAG: DNA polymerase IV [Pseudomonadota bacterium]
MPPAGSVDGAETICHDCGAGFAALQPPCPRCGGARLVTHVELASLSIGHVDCDAFYASVEKRDRPELAHRPVIVGGGRRGVVTAACYLARRSGVRSAMPMFKARAACPEAVVVKPDMAKYAAVGREVRALMQTLTPLVEPISIDEAFLDLSGTEKLHGGPPAATLARFAARVEAEIGITVSIGLSWNKYLAKIASELDKPRGFAVIGRADAIQKLAPLPLSAVWGVGPKFAARLLRDGFETVGDVQRAEDESLARRYGSSGARLARLARGEAARDVTPERTAKSVSHETTFADDIADPAVLADRLWPLCEKTAARLREKAIVGRTVTLKLKTADFESRTRSVTLERPTDLSARLFDAALGLLYGAADGARFRLIGVGVSGLADAEAPQTDLFGTPDAKAKAREAAMDAVRARFGAAAIGTGRAAGRR